MHFIIKKNRILNIEKITQFILKKKKFLPPLGGSKSLFITESFIQSIQWMNRLGTKLIILFMTHTFFSKTQIHS